MSCYTHGPGINVTNWKIYSTQHLAIKWTNLQNDQTYQNQHLSKFMMSFTFRGVKKKPSTLALLKQKKHISRGREVMHAGRGRPSQWAVWPFDPPLWGPKKTFPKGHGFSTSPKKRGWTQWIARLVLFPSQEKRFVGRISGEQTNWATKIVFPSN